MKIAIYFLAIWGTISGCHFNIPSTPFHSWDNLSTVELSGDEIDSLLSKTIRRQMHQTGISHEVNQDNPYRIVLTEYSEQTYPLTISGDFATAQEYELIAIARFSLRDTHNKILAPTQSMRAVRYSSRSPQSISGQQYQERVLWEEIRTELARHILSHLSLLVTYADSPAQPSATPQE